MAQPSRPTSLTKGQTPEARTTILLFQNLMENTNQKTTIGKHIKMKKQTKHNTKDYHQTIVKTTKEGTWWSNG